MSYSAHAVQWEGKGDNNRGLIYGIEYMDGDEVADVEWFKSARIRDGNLKLYLDDLKTWDKTFNADESMSPAEFAKLMGAYPEPAGNPSPAYGGFMDNSAANFSWVNNNDHFGAESKGNKTIHCDSCDTEDWDYLYEVADLYLCGTCQNLPKYLNYKKGYTKESENAESFNAEGVHHDGGRSDGGKFLSNCCDGDITTMDGKKWKCMKCNSPLEVNVEELEEWYGADTDLTPTNQMNNSIGQVVPITNPMELPTNLIETEAGGGPEGQITPDVFSAETNYCYGCGLLARYVPNQSLEEIEVWDREMRRDKKAYSCSDCYDDLVYDAESFEAFNIGYDDTTNQIHIENKCDGCGKDFLLTENPNLVGGNRAGAIVYEVLDGGEISYPEHSPYGDLLCKACWKINKEEDENADSRGQGQYGAEREDTLIKGFYCNSTEACRETETVVRMRREDKTAKCLECDYVWKMQTIDGIREFGAESESNSCDVCETNKLLFEMTDMAANEVLCQSCIQDGHDSHWTIKTHIPETFPVDSEAYKTPKTEVGYTVGNGAESESCKCSPIVVCDECILQEERGWEDEVVHCDTCQKDKPIVAHVEFDGPFLSALCKECYAEHLEMGGKPNVYDAESFQARNRFMGDGCGNCGTQGRYGVEYHCIFCDSAICGDCYRFTPYNTCRDCFKAGRKESIPQTHMSAESCTCNDMFGSLCPQCNYDSDREGGVCPKGCTVDLAGSVRPQEMEIYTECKIHGQKLGAESFNAESENLSECCGESMSQRTAPICSACGKVDYYIGLDGGGYGKFTTSECCGKPHERTAVLTCDKCNKIDYGAESFNAEGESLWDLMLKKYQKEMTEQADCKCIDEDSCYGCGACYGCERGVGLMPINGKCGCGWTGKNHPQNKKQHEGDMWSAETFEATEYCGECSDKHHDSCPLIEGCPCCDNTRKALMNVAPHTFSEFPPIGKYDAEMDIVADGMAVVSNIRDEVVGVVEVIDDEDDDEMVEISIQDENLEEIGSFTLDDGMILDDEDNYLAESKTPSLLTLGIGVVAAIFAFPYLKDGVSKVFGADNDVQENEPELIENPDMGDLDPAAYEELVVESTGYALDIIPMGLDGSFMGSRFAALPTERYVDYNDPGIGAHIDIALNRDETFLEPEMAMVQAAEGETVVKETQAPGQSPYFQMGQEPVDMNYRVIKETHPVSLDPAVKPFIPQSMTGYTGNKNTPPSVYNKMFNIGVLGQTPLFTPQDAEDIGASRAGSRRAKPNILGLNGSVGGPLSDKVNANYTDGTTSMSLAQWAQENTVSQSSDTEAVVIDRSSGAMKRVRRV